jgi:hypothetical protein
MRLVERAMIVLLGAWCVIGITHTARSLLGPAGWAAGRPDTESGFVGMPLSGSTVVVAVGRLLEVNPEVEDPALVILPVAVAPSVLLYIDYQLAHTRYPRRVDVLEAGAPAPSINSYATIVAATEVRLDAPWRMTATLAGFSAWERETP